MNDVKIFRSTLFWIITVFFTIIIVLTILNVFFGIGKLNPEFQSKLFYAFLVEIAAAIFALFYALFNLKKQDGKDSIIPNKLSDIAPAKADVSEKEIQTAATEDNDIYVGPDRSFQIKQPPSSWKIVEKNYTDLAVDMRGIKNKVLIDSIKRSAKIDSDVVLFDSGHSFWIQPKPGQTIINEASILTALDTASTNSLLIIPFDHYTAPTYFNTNVEKLLIQYIDQLELLPVLDIKKLSSGTVKPSNRKIIEIEAVQRLQNVIINQSDFSLVEQHYHFFSIEGEKKNYIIQVSYIITSGNQPDKFKDDQKILFELIDTFKPLRANNQKEIDDEKVNAEKKQLEFNTYAGERILIAELTVLFSRISDESFTNSEQLQKLTKTLRQFQSFANLVKPNKNIQSDLNFLWPALDKAEQGITDDLKNQIQRILVKMNSSPDNIETENVLPAAQ